MKKKKKLSDKRKLRDFFTGAMAELRRAAPCCRHFGECGGCEFQDVPYAEQPRVKRAAFDFVAARVSEDFREQAAADAEKCGRLESLAELLGEMLDGVGIGVVESPEAFGYRQRMDYVFAFGAAGLRRANRHRQVVELEECPLLGDAGFGVFQKAKRLAVDSGLESYDYMRHTGELRYFVVRRSREGGVLLSLVTKSRAPEAAVLSILRRLVDDGDIVSGHWLLAEGLGDVSFGGKLAHAGREWIAETMNGVKLRIGPNTFFQSNPAVAEKAYAAIRDFAPTGATALDMYSGVGCIALNVAGRAGRVLAVECAPDNVELARTNIAESGVDNIELVLEDAAAYLGKLDCAPDLLVLNPPRAGVEGDGMASIARLGPRRIAYLSCNPFTLCRNLAEIAGEYRLASLTIYDMFPQTRHFESLALLERK